MGKRQQKNADEIGVDRMDKGVITSTGDDWKLYSVEDISVGAKTIAIFHYRGDNVIRSQRVASGLLASI